MMRPLSTLTALGLLTSGGLAQTPAPKVDHHMHIWTAAAAELVTQPLPPIIEVPEELARLLRAKEDWDLTKDRAKLLDVYTDDAAVLEPSNIWQRGKKALDFIASSTTIYRLMPTAYDLGETHGYVAGMEANVGTVSTEYLSSFLYALRKGKDGQWRVSAETFTMAGPSSATAVTPEQIIADLDAAGIRKGVVLSTAFWYASPLREIPVEDERVKLQAENDWVAAQVAKHPDRLIGFYSVNPLSDYAADEIRRCAKNPSLTGLKLHLGNSRVDLLLPEHVEKLRNVFKVANELRQPIVAHLWKGGDYGPKHSEAFLREVVSAAPDIPIQIAHMAASGPGYHSDDALEVFARAAVANDPLMKNLYFDVASDVVATTPRETLDLVAKRLRQLGMKRILFASDRSYRNETPSEAWRSFQRLPLTSAEFTSIANNVAPYVR